MLLEMLNLALLSRQWFKYYIFFYSFKSLVLIKEEYCLNTFAYVYLRIKIYIRYVKSNDARYVILMDLT